MGMREQIVRTNGLQLSLVFELTIEVTVKTGIGADEQLVQIATLGDDMKRCGAGLEGRSAAPIGRGEAKSAADIAAAHETES